MTIRDTSKGYSWLSILFHWVTAVTVISLWLIGELAEDAPQEERSALLGLHISIVMSLYLVLWARIIWRLSVKRPALPQQQVFLGILARWVPFVLLAGIVLMLVSGPLMIWSAGYDINIFNTVTLPTPMSKSEPLHEAMEDVHGFGAKLLFLGVILHVLGGLKHLVFDRDGTLSRIFIPGNKP